MSIDKSQRPRNRVQLDFSGEAWRRTMALKKRLDAPNNAELMRTALRLLGWALDAKERGETIHITKADGTTHAVEFLL